MSRTYGLDSALKYDNEIYHIETFAEPKLFKLISQTFKSGRVLDIKETNYDHQIREKTLIDLIQALHNHQIESLANLLKLAESISKSMHADAMNKIGVLFMAKGFYQEAKKTLSNAIKLDPQLTDAHRNMGNVYKKIGDIDRAIAQYTRALYLAPANADYYLDLGLAYLEKDMYDEAFQELGKAIDFNKNFADAYFNLGLLILKEKILKSEKPNEKDVISSIVNLKYASLLDPRFQVDAFKRAIQNLEEKEFSAAHKQLSKIKEEMKKTDIHEFIYDFELFSKYSDLKEVSITVDEYIDIMYAKIETSPQYADLRNALGKAYLIKMRSLFNAALTQFKRAVEINPNYQHATRNLELVENEIKGFMLFLRAILK
ncbi:hypothetical protein A2Y85_02125 [candidate division WOR-3 bacterium RBG_13_43_14]|uniref:UDP-N-acetylglucosamine--peptide N-acetylglucosaminyltransferase SPINDLY n=1 Tax=candidate division WOR-3 bacterium RBG_13_43_14 TaxID=1802590 RepID=A0A1F4U2T7_UNCW3|nr:MAG: hypothetical protein A2Y85_02125 [candidate division WOR-3 bacterium RBG_13_43_14]